MASISSDSQKGARTRPWTRAQGGFRKQEASLGATPQRALDLSPPPGRGEGLRKHGLRSHPQRKRQLIPKPATSVRSIDCRQLVIRLRIRAGQPAVRPSRLPGTCLALRVPQQYSGGDSQRGVGTAAAIVAPAGSIARTIPDRTAALRPSPARNAAEGGRKMHRKRSLQTTDRT